MTHACFPHHVEKHIGPTLRQARYAFEASLKARRNVSFPPAIEVVLCSAADKLFLYLMADKFFVFGGE
jgi:hypothetical protein